MSWTCPYEVCLVKKGVSRRGIPPVVNAYCKKLNRLCQPGMKGCVLDRRVKFIDLSREESLSNKKKKTK